MNSPTHAMAEDLEALAEQGLRYAGTEGERAMLHRVEARLGDGLRDKARVEGFVGHGSPEMVLALHAALLLAAGLLGFWIPWAGAVLCATVTASLTAEGTGRMSLLRWFLGKVPSYNLTVRLPARGRSLGTVVISAPLDTPHWRPQASVLKRPLRAVYGAALFLTIMCVLHTFAEPWGAPTLGLYVLSLCVLAFTIGFAWFVRRRVQTGSSEASGPAVLLEVLRRVHERPIDDLDVWGVFTGCGHAYQGGMQVFLEKWGPRLSEPVLVIALDRPGIAPVGAAVSEGQLWPVHYRSTGPALVERMRWAGIEVPLMDKGGATDARAAHLLGFRALALCGSGQGSAGSEVALHAADITETVARWLADDLHRVAGRRPLWLERHLVPSGRPTEPVAVGQER